MAVLIEGITLVVPVGKLEKHQPGGTNELLRMVGNRRFCCDDSIAAVVFGAHDGDLAGAVSNRLRRAGLIGSRFGYWKDIAVIYQKTASPTLPCDWLFIGRNDDGIVFASLDVNDLEPFEIMVPTAWKLEDSFSKRVSYVPLDQYDSKFEYVGSDETADVYRDRETGKQIRAALARSQGTGLPSPELCLEEEGQTGGDQVTRYRQMPDSTPKAKEKKPMFDEDGNEIVKVTMGFADYHEFDENAEEGEYLDDDVYAVQVAPNRYRLEENPMFTEMATFHDVVEGEVDEYGVFYVQRVVEKSGLKTIRTGAPPFLYFSDAGKAFFDRVVNAGGMWDILWWGILVFNIPEDRADEFEELYSEACIEARQVEKESRMLPGDLYRHQPGGGRPADLKRCTMRIEELKRDGRSNKGD